jgi:hypothetical protein
MKKEYYVYVYLDPRKQSNFTYGDFKPADNVIIFTRKKMLELLRIKKSVSNS